MSTTAGTADAAAVTPQNSGHWLVRWSPIGGLLFVLGLVGMFISPWGDDTGDTAAEIIERVDANEGWLIATQLFALLSILLVGWFLAGLHARLRAIGAETESVLALVGGVGFSLLFFLAITVWNAPLLGLTESYDDESVRLADAQTILGTDDIGWFVLAGSGVAAAVMILASSIGVLRTRALPSWAGWLSLVLGVLSLGTVAFFGMFAWMAWIAVASIVMLVKSRA